MGFTTEKVSGKKGFANKEEERKSRARQLFAKSGSFTYIGHLDASDLAALVAEQPTPEQAEVIKKYDDSYGPCDICGRTHNYDRADLATFYQSTATKEVITLSDTCRVKYFEGNSLTPAKLLTNPDVYFAEFTKTKKR